MASRGHGNRSGRHVQDSAPAGPPGGVGPAPAQDGAQGGVVQRRVEVAGQYPQHIGLRRRERGEVAGPGPDGPRGRRRRRRVDGGDSIGCAPGTSITAVGCSKVPGTAPAATAGIRVQIAPEAAGALPGRAGITCAQGRRSPMPAARRPALGPRGQLLDGQDVDVEPAHEVEDGAGAHHPLRRLTVAIRTLGPSRDPGRMAAAPGQHCARERRARPRGHAASPAGEPLHATADREREHRRSPRRRA